MADYKKMYYILFREITKTISALQVAQQQVEEIYLEEDTIDSLIVFDQNRKDGDK